MNQSLYPREGLWHLYTMHLLNICSLIAALSIAVVRVPNAWGDL